MTRNRSVVGLPVGVVALAGHAVVLASLALPAVVHAAEGGEASLIEVNWTLGVQLISFLLLLAVLYKLLYRPLLGALEGRSAAIQQQLAEAQGAREEAQRALGAMEERIRTAQAEAQALRERALREAAELRERLSGEARQEATRLVEAAQAQVGQEVRRARTELRAEVGALATQIAERLVRKSLSDEDHQRLVREALARIEPA
ncbi:MAG TPA: F0F1 ATP synthase subunit B [Methylomirabilota bacterium]|nr:F0F1 ATP synthase subunit B [Methylomirabilota bacterium]